MNVTRFTRLVQLVTLVTSWYNVGTIWMVQVSWRLFARVGRAEFPAYHRAWWFGLRGIQPVVFPSAILTLLGSIAQLRWRPPRVRPGLVWLGVTLQGLTYGLTAVWWGRWQAQLTQVWQEDGTLNPHYRRILTTHWLRVALITAAALLQSWITATGLLGREGNRGESGETHKVALTGRWRGVHGLGERTAGTALERSR